MPYKNIFFLYTGTGMRHVEHPVKQGISKVVICHNVARFLVPGALMKNIGRDRSTDLGVAIVSCVPLCHFAA